MIKSITELELDLREDLQAFNKVRKCIGIDCITTEGKQKIAAIDNLLSATEFAYSINDFIETVMEQEKGIHDSQIYEYMKKWIKHNLDITI